MRERKNKKLYFVGIGPGDPELLTLKAMRLIKTSDVLFVPVRKKQGTESATLNIVRQAIDINSANQEDETKKLIEKKVRYLHFPMIKGSKKLEPAVSQAADEVNEFLKQGQTGVFITLGCSTIYSTAGNLFLAMKAADTEIIFVPGISAINGAAAASVLPLVLRKKNWR